MSTMICGSSETVAKRAGSLTETLESRRLDSYHGSLFVWIRAIWEMSERMTQSNSLGLPKHVATKIEKVFGISSSELNGYDLVRMIEELCDTALMFDREERGTGGWPY